MATTYTTFDKFITLTRPGKSWRTVNGVLREYDVNEPVLTPDGWSLRPAETNLALDITRSSWRTGGVTKQASAIPAPIDDLGTFTKLVPSTNSEQHYVATDLPVTEGKTYTLSGFFLAGEYTFAQLAFNGTYFPLSGRRVFFDLESGEVSWQQSGPVATIEKLSGGVFRFHATAVATATGSAGEMFYINALKTGSTGVSDLTFSGDGTSGIYVWGVQVNEGDPIPYIPTTTGAVTRPADDVVIQGDAFASVFNPMEGAIILDFKRHPFDVGGGSLFRIDDTSNANQIWCSASSANGLVFQTLKESSVTKSFPVSPVDFSAGVKVGYVWDATTLKIYVDEILRGTAAVGADVLMSMMSRFRLAYAQPYIARRLTIFTRRPSDAQMEALTS